MYFGVITKGFQLILESKKNHRKYGLIGATASSNFGGAQRAETSPGTYVKALLPWLDG